ncbi:RHH/copG family antitoxin [Halanaeroarchaeum sp. HSR-CO]|uniref:antitoxin VapB family protein n=1 Tax=Halanaeroarchaeum sp. HSR-CO TaxID=2866382 RepID=UPI00217CF5EA|nr:antitoxin VapB family protein [Halanaeroarchaeum sp. HSR-CO]UWG48147.1 RHH/copG family antitoxin [Halanaeroarchaeum sp. HSR-CO]
MSKNISLSDDVYEALVREKGDRSFSEVIAAKLEAGGTLQEVTGQQILDESTYEAVTDDIARLSEGTAERLDS